MGFDHQYMTGLNLGLGFSSSAAATAAAAAKKTSFTTATATAADFEPSLTLALSGADHRGSSPGRAAAAASHIDVNASPCGLYGRQASPHSAVSSLSGGGGGRVKRERDVMSGDEVEVDHDKVISSRGSDEDEDGSNARKKLRLTKEQSALLEESFKQHSTLNPKQKQALARQLNLRPRQVEVWFQNRRARTKLKQTEVDCEFLKKCCETLTDENRRLQKELQELKALKLAQPLYMHMPAATLTMCPSCERIGGAGGVGAAAGDIVGPGSAAKGAFSLAAKTHFFNPFTNPSAAC